MSPNGQGIQKGSRSTRHWCSSQQFWPWRAQNPTQPIPQLELKQYKAAQATGAFYSQTDKKSFRNLTRGFKIMSQGPDLPRQGTT